MPLTLQTELKRLFRRNRILTQRLEPQLGWLAFFILKSFFPKNQKFLKSVNSVIKYA